MAGKEVLLLRMKKLMAGIAALCLLAVLLPPLRAYAAEQSKGTTITTTVPDTHTIALEIGSHGSVSVEETPYTGANAGSSAKTGDPSELTAWGTLLLLSVMLLLCSDVRRQRRTEGER